MPPPRLHPLDRSPRVNTLNRWLEASWSRGFSSYPSLDPAELRTKTQFLGACAARDESDIRDFEERLEALCAALTQEAQLNPLGRTIAHGQITRIMRLRGALGAMWDNRPELVTTPLAPPIIVAGQMRSGTTRIHRLLAADPAHCATRFCDSWTPVPSKPDLRPLFSSIALAMGRAVNPWLDTVHPFGAARADEELGWLAASLDHATFEAQWRIPSFSRWSEARDTRPLASEFARILRSDAAHAGSAAQPRVMKCPQFSEMLPALLEQFPDARLVVAQRDDEAVLHSCISLVANQMAVQSNSADLGFIESEWRRKLALRAERLEAALAQFDGPVAHLSFEALSTDWETAIERAYSALDIPLTMHAKTAMRREMKKGATYQHHAAQMENFREPDDAPQP